MFGAVAMFRGLRALRGAQTGASLRGFSAAVVDGEGATREERSRHVRMTPEERGPSLKERKGERRVHALRF
jgi:hypothetical protein